MLVLTRMELEMIRIDALGKEYLLTRMPDDPDTGHVVLKVEGPECRLRFVGGDRSQIAFNIGPFDVTIDISRRGKNAKLGFTADRQVNFKRIELDEVA